MITMAANSIMAHAAGGAFAAVPDSSPVQVTR